MPRCEHCGFGHALPDRCVNCGSMDPFPRRRVIKLVLMVLALIAAAVLTFYLYGKAKELQIAEERAKAVGDRVFDVRPPAEAVPGAEAPNPQ